ncbi:MAG TPA: TetR family transcriptional regulator [Candidatus Dormibacteraeota bacterium]|jgi:AcrR family transcriptional regulator|nr:TetR family transcriptional regulator [Candidatus Dormibacteraeota bacterium]
MAVGLRERKKLKTKEAIHRAAMRLFAKRGYEETTVEQIAAAAEISPSTFFNYFPTKEDVVMLDIYDPIAIQMIKERPKNETLGVTFRRVLEGLDAIFERDRELVLERGRIMLEVPELRGRLWDELERTQAFVIELLAERTGRKPDDFELRVTARVAIAALYEASLEWFRLRGRKRLVELANHALDVAESGGRLSAAPARK